MLIDAEDGACRIELRDTEVILESDLAGARPDPGPAIVRDSRGRFYSANATGFPSLINLWSEEGEYLATFGGPGEGPGELSAIGTLSLFVDREDRLHVRDSRPTWTVFGSDQQLVSTVPALNMGTSGVTVLLDDGSILTSQSSPQERQHHFRIVDERGAVIRRIAPADPRVTTITPALDSRPLAYAGGTSFWAAPPTAREHSPDGYLLEEWSTDGDLLRTVRRDVTWFPVDWPPRLMERAPVESESLSPRPPTQVSFLHLDDSGLLLVGIAGVSAAWHPATMRELAAMDEVERNAMYEIRLELIDTLAGTLLASEVIDGMRAPFDRLFPGTRLGFRMEIGPDLLPRAVILSFEPIAR